MRIFLIGIAVLLLHTYTMGGTMSGGSGEEEQLPSTEEIAKEQAYESEEIAKELDMDVEKIEYVMRIKQDIASLDASVGRDGDDEDSVLGDFVEDEERISWFYLMQHYNKENAEKYKAQKERTKSCC